MILKIKSEGQKKYDTAYTNPNSIKLPIFVRLIFDLNKKTYQYNCMEML